MDIEEAKEAKKEVEASILLSLVEFERLTGLRVDFCSINHIRELGARNNTFNVELTVRLE